MKNYLLGAAVVAMAFSAVAERFEFSSGDLTISFRDDGRVTTIKDSAGRNYLGEVSPWVSCFAANGAWIFAEKASKRADGAMVFSFADGSSVAEKIDTFDGGFVFTVVDSTVPDNLQSLNLAFFRPDCVKYIGGFACIASDDERAVSLRSFDYHLDMSTSKEAMKIELKNVKLAKGMRFGLTAGAREGFLTRLRSMVETSGLFYSKAGGPWSLGSEEARQSYFFANMLSKDADAWIDMVKRSGASIMHFHAWEESLGHYQPSRAKYTKGLSTMKEVADKARAAGLGISMHSLTACISFHDKWVTPVAHSNLIATYTYTLSKPLDESSSEVLVEELPGPKHDMVTTYTSNGNYLNIDGEIISYTGIRREKPYAFTGIKRGDLKTTVFNHPAGVKVKYLQQRYFCFYPEPDSPLAEELADCLSGVYNAIGASMIYFDGSEGMKSNYGASKMGAMIASRLDSTKHPPRIEMSATFPHYWPFRSTIGAWDNVCYGAKGFEDDHIKANISSGRLSNFLDGQMGWWAPQVASKQYRSRFPDETEYFAAKNAGNDFAMSLQGFSIREGTIPELQERALTLIGWYERFRLARAFSPQVLKELERLGKEGYLRQDDGGEWTYTPVKVLRHRVIGDELGEKWSYNVKQAMPISLRVETFYNLSPFDSPAAAKVFDVETFLSAKTESTGKVKIKAQGVEDPERGKVTRITAYNDSPAAHGSWGALIRSWAYPYLNLGNAEGVGFWVKGDGSGAILNIELNNPREHSFTHADHLVKLDFNGWRYVECPFRERDTEEAAKYVWPHRITHPEQMCRLYTPMIESVRFYLNEIPVSAAEGVLDGNATDASARQPSVDILVSDIKALGLKPTTAEEVTIKFNGKKYELPFEELAAGDWADLKDGRWTLYDERGTFKESAEGPKLSFKAGENKFKYSADVSGKAAARAEIKVFVEAKSTPALVKLSDQQRAALNWEAEMPANWSPSKGAQMLPSVKVRPGEKAKLEVKIRGPVANPVLKVGGKVWKLQSVADKQTRTFTDGPVVSGVVKVEMESSDPTTANALVEFVKNYQK